MKKLTRKDHIKLLTVLVAALVFIVLLISFSKDARIPTWADLFGLKTPDEDADYVRFIDVGQGDSILIYSNGMSAMIDFGDNVDDGADLISSLRKYGIKKLDCMIITHYDADHIGGADTVLEQLDVDNIILPQRYEEDSFALDEVDKAVARSDAAVYDAELGTKIYIGDFTLTIVAYYPDEADTNERSIIVMAEMEDKKFLFTGDAASSVEKQMMEDEIDLDCDVFKAGHHGSKYSNNLEFLQYVTPEYAVISCGELNNYGHPHSEVLKNFNTVDATVFRTDIDGDITFYVEEGKLRVDTEYK